jgi:DNA-binding transcriptional LysR family regulator
MDFREFAYIVSIANHQGVGKAADDLHVSQPTLSKFVQNIENDLGFPLFNKLGNKFVLTYAGKRYYDTAKAVLIMKRDLDNELSEILKEKIGKLQIGLPNIRGMCILPRTLPLFRDRYPNVKISIHEASSNIMEQMVLNGDLDLAFIVMPHKHPNLTYEPITNEEILLIMSPNHPNSASGIFKEGFKHSWIDLSKLESEQFILQWPDQRTRQVAERIFDDVGIKPKKILTIRNIFTSMQLTANGYGISFSGEYPIRYIHLDKKLVCFSVGRTPTTFNLMAVYRSEINLPMFTREFIEIVKKSMPDRITA